jgi:hypothetical protein
MSVKNILKGFGSLISGDPLTEEQKKRAEICASCPLKSYHKTLTIIDKDFETKEVKGYTCDECSCYLPSKIRVDEESCPLGKWKSIKK